MLPAGEWVQCVPNLSEGRDAEVVRDLAREVEAAPGVLLTDCSTDPDHHRAVLTFVGSPAAVHEAAIRVARAAVERIDLRRHRGVHPRMGALDVLPFVPLGETSMETCVRLARSTGDRIGAELDLPVYFYEEAATRPERRALPTVRNRGFEALRAAPLDGEWLPDAGPEHAHPSAGAVAVGARGPLIAFNVNLRTSELDVARRVAAAVRERGGGLPGVRALGLLLETRGCAQVSLNITRPAETSLYRVVELVRLEAARYGVAIAGCELIGAVRLEELAEVARCYLGLHELRSAQVLEPWLERLAAAGGDALDPK